MALFVTPIAMVLVIAIRRHHGAASRWRSPASPSPRPRRAASRATPATAGVLITVDDLSIVAAAVLTVGAGVVALMSRLYLARTSARPEEYYALLAIAAPEASRSPPPSTSQACSAPWKR